jgi:chemotaxis signal transduction protein
MTRTSLARYRRFKQPQEPSLRLITFPLRQQWFCLPLVLARRVIPGPEHGLTPIPGLTQMQQENIPLVDIASLVYQEAPILPADTSPAPRPETLTTPGQAILVIDPPQLGSIGLLIDGTPAIKRVKQSAFNPVPAVYLIMNRLQGINTLVNQGDNQPPLFLLEIDALLAKLMHP